jgi:hypothetical protein
LLPLDLRPKKTRAIRRRLTKHQVFWIQWHALFWSILHDFFSALDRRRWRQNERRRKTCTFQLESMPSKFNYLSTVRESSLSLL